jgi:hypothetical protein
MVYFIIISFFDRTVHECDELESFRKEFSTVFLKYYGVIHLEGLRKTKGSLYIGRGWSRLFPYINTEFCCYVDFPGI